MAAETTRPTYYNMCNNRRKTAASQQQHAFHFSKNNQQRARPWRANAQVSGEAFKKAAAIHQPETKLVPFMQVRTHVWTVMSLESNRESLPKSLLVLCTFRGPQCVCIMHSVIGHVDRNSEEHRSLLNNAYHF